MMFVTVSAYILELPNNRNLTYWPFRLQSQTPLSKSDIQLDLAGKRIHEERMEVGGSQSRMGSGCWLTNFLLMSHCVLTMKISVPICGSSFITATGPRSQEPTVPWCCHIWVIQVPISLSFPHTLATPLEIFFLFTRLQNLSLS